MRRSHVRVAAEVITVFYFAKTALKKRVSVKTGIVLTEWNKKRPSYIFISAWKQKKAQKKQKGISWIWISARVKKHICWNIDPIFVSIDHRVRLTLSRWRWGVQPLPALCRRSAATSCGCNRPGRQRRRYGRPGAGRCCSIHSPLTPAQVKDSK